MSLASGAQSETLFQRDQYGAIWKAVPVLCFCIYLQAQDSIRMVAGKLNKPCLSGTFSVMRMLLTAIHGPKPEEKTKKSVDLTSAYLAF